MHDLTSPAGIVAIAAGAVGVLAVIGCVILALKLRRVRAAQHMVLGGRRQDLVAHAASLQQQFEALSAYVDEAAQRMNERIDAAEQRLDGAVAYHSLVRYNAWGDTSGIQSTSIALLDATRSGIVLSSILHRDQARVYAKQVRGGQGELELSPEEDEAVRLALEGNGSRAASA
ncbi:MAG: DUF4446 family protein [Solirubrobacterales bacterium]|nr:DUF4446 family protein [Solirubrobacterales bacterium]